MIVLLDRNVVLDALLGREPWRAEADAIWDANRDGLIDARISAAALPTLNWPSRSNEERRKGATSLAQAGRSKPIRSRCAAD